MKNPRATEDQSRVSSIAIAAAKRAGWKLVADDAAVALEIRAWNPRGDIDGRPKVILDALIGIVYDDDKRIKRLVVEDDLDRGEPRYEIRLATMPARRLPPRARAMRFEDLDPTALERLRSGEPFLLDPAPGVVRPLPSDRVPAAWLRRARRATLEQAA